MQQLQNSDGYHDTTTPTFPDLEAGTPIATPHTAVAPFPALLDTLVARLDESASALLLYNLLVHCPAFREAALVRSDADALMLPLLRRLYSVAPVEAPHEACLLQVRSQLAVRICAAVQMRCCCRCSGGCTARRCISGGAARCVLAADSLFA